jgi:hypothetical protein
MGSVASVREEPAVSMFSVEDCHGLSPHSAYYYPLNMGTAGCSEM